jgi:hypothetical protein
MRLWPGVLAPSPHAGSRLDVPECRFKNKCMQRSATISKGDRSMIDPSVRNLLERAIDTPIKLQLLLVYYENPRFEGTASQIAERIYRDIWSTRQALSEMTEDGLLTSTSTGNGEPIYRYRPHPEHCESIFRLAQTYNEPFEREALQQTLREISSYAPYRRKATFTPTSIDRLPI